MVLGSGNVFGFPDKLRKALDKVVYFPVSVIYAEAGYGKTTAVTEYLIKEKGSDMRCLMYTCLLSQPCYAWRSICRLFCEVDEVIGQTLMLFSEPTSENVSDISIELGHIKCDIPTLLVLDNYQEMQFRIPDLLIEAFSMHNCENLHILILTRSCMEDIYRLNSRVYIINAEILTLNYDDMEQLLWNRMDKIEQYLLIRIAAFGEITLSQVDMLCGCKRESECVSVILRHMPYISYNDKQTYIMQEILQEFLWIQYERMKKKEQRKICVELKNICEKSDMLFTLCRRPMVALRFIASLFLQGEIYSCKKFIWKISDMHELCDVISVQEYQWLKAVLKMMDAMTSFMDMKDISDIFNEAYRNLEWDSPTHTLKNIWEFVSPSVVCQLWKKSGLLDETQKSLIEFLSCYPRLKYDYGVVTDVIAKAEIHFMRGEFRHAKELCLQTIVIAHKYSQRGICITAEFILARVAIMNGNKEEYLKSLTRIEQYEREDCKKEFQQMAILCRDYLNMLLEQYDEISFWMKDRNDIDEHIDYPIVPFAQIIYASLMYQKCQKHYIDSNTYCTTLMELCMESDERHMLLPKIYYYIFESMAKNDIGDLNGAKIALKKALDCTMCDKVYVPFAEFYSYISGILDRIALEYGRFDDISNIVKLGKKINHGRVEMSMGFNKNKQCLTQREFEIARLLCQRFTCKEIADKLNISVNTVRNITQNIYQKLEIHSKKELCNALTHSSEIGMFRETGMQQTE